MSAADTAGGSTTEEQPAVIEDDAQEQQRKQELDERIQAQGGMPEPPEDDDATRGVTIGSPGTMIAEARKHQGYREKGENDTIFTRWLGPIQGYGAGGFGYPWCHAFVSYCLAHSGNADAGPRTASCPAGVQWFRSAGRFGSEPRAGDLVYYGADGGTHVELVTGVSSTTITTIGGNTSGSLNGAYFNGDGVYEKSVSRSSSRIFGYGRPKYSSGGGGAGATPARALAGGGAAVKPMTNVRSIRKQQEAVNALGFAPPLDVDGEWGPKTAQGVKWLQKKIGAGADGQWGQETESKLAAFGK
jgi:uncharacterized protein (TIGR02594 family)